LKAGPSPLFSAFFSPLGVQPTCFSGFSTSFFPLPCFLRLSLDVGPLPVYARRFCVFSLPFLVTLRKQDVPDLYPGLSAPPLILIGRATTPCVSRIGEGPRKALSPCRRRSPHTRGFHSQVGSFCWVMGAASRSLPPLHSPFLFNPLPHISDFSPISPL